MDILEQMEVFSQGTLSVSDLNWGLSSVLAILIVWSLVWKGLALWRAARLAHKWWFIVILIISSLGVLEIIYLSLVSNKYTVESKELKDIN